MTDLDAAKVRALHTTVMLPVLGGSALLGSVWHPDISTQVAIMSIGVATIGLGHGALDHRVGEVLMRSRFGPNWWILFTVSYLFLASASFAGWIEAPAIALIVFLAYSAFHFGSDRFQANGLVNAVSRGAIPLLLPIAFHSEEVSRLFSTVTATNFKAVQYWLPAVVLSVIAVIVTLATAVRRGQYTEATETAMLVVLNFTSPPLIAFTLYFVLLHSIRHIIELAGWLEPRSLKRGFQRVARESLPLTIFVVVAGTIGISLMSVDDVQPAIIRMVFVGLSCLTVPHMLVTHFAEKHLAT